jgi:hypothetical protein
MIRQRTSMLRYAYTSSLVLIHYTKIFDIFSKKNFTYMLKPQTSQARTCQKRITF